ncbi:unnamed protein product [Cylindrotheca closterium]|uniref:Orc1-like AAA ATPase domain-containing protein n=1 Tax=Cylindrotheca closterium TaxID=2856 RepID=A0AAD2FP33_9STRA|nr:unnamed protein product [Cylindrotheca closterium]
MASANNDQVKKRVSIPMSSKDEATITTYEYTLPGDDDDSFLVDESDLMSSRSGSFKRIDTTGSVFSNSSGSISMSARSTGSSNAQEMTSMRSKSICDDELNLIDRNSVKQKKSSQALAGLTINKLNTSNIGLIGREKQVKILHSCYSTIMDSKKEEGIYAKNRQLVFIKGYAGVGKSMLAKTLEQKVSSTDKGCFVEGKFDYNHSDEPYSGIAAAFGNIFDFIMKDSQGRDFSTITEKITSRLGEDVKMMMYLVPQLDELIGDYSTSGVESNEGAFDPTSAEQRWKYAFRMLARALTSTFHPLVMVLDDLQWADVSSLDVIEYLVSDVENPNPLMIVGSYRSNEVDENSILYNRIQSLLGKCDKFCFKIREIDVPSFDVNDVNKMVMSMLSIDDDEDATRDLAEICYKRTQGNPFFLSEFMLLLYEEKLVEFNLGLMAWKWEASEIDEKTMATANVVNLLQTRMRKMNLDVQNLLQYAACLGTSFTMSNLQLIWKEEGDMQNSNRLTVADFLNLTKQESLIESNGGSEYRWVHDKVQEAALHLSDTVNDAFRFDIGITLLHGMTPNEVEEKLFDMVDLINSGKVNKAAEFAELNLRAAEKARTMSALQSASAYAVHGIGFLPGDHWESHRPLALKLYTMAAEVELALGRVESSEKYGNEVLGQDNMSLMETLPFRLAKARNLCYVQLKFDDAINYCIPILRDLGHNLTWSRKAVPIQAVRSLLRSVKALKQAPKEMWENVSKTTDPKEQSVALLMRQLNYAGYNSEDVFLSILCNARLGEMTLKHGVNQSSASAIATLGGAILMVQQDYETCEQLGTLALSLERRIHGIHIAETVYCAYAYGLSWTRMLGDCVMPAMEGYTLGMQKGDTPFASWNLMQHFVFLPYTMGKALGPMLEEFPRILAQLENVAQSGHVLVLRLFWQMMLDMQRTLQPSTNQLEGEIFSRSKDNEQSPVHRGTVHLCEGELMIFCGDYESAATRAIKKAGKYEKALPGFFMIMIETFHRAVALYAMAQKTKRLKYRSRADAIRKTMMKWMKRGNPNVVYFVEFLTAEHYALASKLDKAEEHYRKSIVFTARTGYLHHSGLFNERYADFLLSKRKDVNEAKYRLEEAIRYYEEWGATGKVQQLKDRLTSLS